jgi:ferredoxin
MPAWEEEICAAEDEGIQIIHLAAPQKIINKNDKISALRVMKMELKEPDASGRRRPVPILGSEYDIEIDQLISAIGQEADTDAAAAEQIELGRFNNIKADKITGETNLSGVFAGGDVVYGPRMVVDAVAAGKRASVAIDCYLQKKPVPNPIVRPRSRGSVPFLDLTAQEKVDLKRPHPGQVPVEDRVKNFRQVDLDLTQDMAVNEAKRCLRCDRCRGDGLCMFACTEMGINALTLNSTKKERLAFFDFSGTDEKCIGCGSCAEACPHDNIVVNDDAGKRKIFFCGTLIAEFDLEPCERCGTPFAPKAYLDLVKKRADSAAGADIERKLCPDCARAVRAERIAGEFSSF